MKQTMKVAKVFVAVIGVCASIGLAALIAIVNLGAPETQQWIAFGIVMIMMLNAVGGVYLTVHYAEDLT